MAAGLHQVGDGAAVPRTFQHERRHDGGGLWVIQPQAAGPPLVRQPSGHVDEQPFLLMRRDQHK
jgi:hypothetical protein